MITMEQADYCTLHLDAAFRSMVRHIDSEDKTDVKKAVNHGVRAAILYAQEKPTGPEAIFQLFEYVRYHISLLTTNELMQIFPIDKEYDGKRWGCKDYFFSMDALRAHGLDTPIGAAVDVLLWDYMNRTMMDFSAEYTSIASKLYREITGEGIMERFCRENSIEYYTKDTGEDGREYLASATTGRRKRVFPGHLKVIPGGQDKEVLH